METMEAFIREIPKAELHIHIEGSLEPEMALEFGERNGIELPFATPEEARRAYRFADLESFLTVYYQSAAVLRRERDFHDLTLAYLKKSHSQNVRHCEIFFDPQLHTDRGVDFETVMSGLLGAIEEARHGIGISVRLILCFLRHLSADAAMETLISAIPFKERIVAVGLDSSEAAHPPEKFGAVFARARREGFLTVAHAGEEGPPEYIRQALDVLRVSRIDHGVRCLEDPDLVKRLAESRIPLTVCPLSNVKLAVFDSIAQHNLKKLIDLGLCVTVNSDDPAYFGGYVTENLLAVQKGLGLGRDEIYRLSRNSFEAAFVEHSVKQKLIDELDDFVGNA